MLPSAWPLATEEEVEEGEEAMDVTERECEEPVEGERDEEQRPFLMSQTETESRAPARRCLPEESYEMLESTETITPKTRRGSYRRYAFTISPAKLF